MDAVFGPSLDSPRTITFASAASLALGLVFTFVWAPHPWGWTGIDEYHDLARALAAGQGFLTIDRPWGYAAYVAAFYRLFGERPWIPILGQVIANAFVPLLVFALARPLAGRRTATLAALLTGLFSFNTIYASTQASDALCTVLVLGATVAFTRARATGRLALFVASGLLAALAAQFRPNMVLLPVVVAAFYLVWGGHGRMRATAAFLAAALVVVAPWTVRNYRLAGAFLPTSSRGAIQLWYGSLQVGPYLENYSLNPRRAFELPSLDYTSLAGQPILVSAALAPCAAPGTDVALEYWTDRAPARSPIAATLGGDGRLHYAIPGQPAPTTIHYRFMPAPEGTPAAVYFVSTDHTGDLDRDDEVADVHDLMRVAQRAAGDPPARALLEPTILAMLGLPASDVPPLRSFAATDQGATLEFSDGSWMRVPRHGGGITDIVSEGTLARTLAHAHALRARAPAGCAPVTDVRLNDEFYRRELQQMQRYSALAMDNIRRDPGAFALATAYRALRLFVVRPAGGDGTATYQYAWASAAYTAGAVVSFGVFAVFVAGAVLAWTRRRALLPLLIPIAYIPATISPLLNNQRYTVTVQPLMFIFVALAVVVALRLEAGGGAGEGTAR